MECVVAVEADYGKVVNGCASALRTVHNVVALFLPIQE
jgi:hypothetical protein